MNLTKQKIQDLIKNPKNKAHIDAAIRDNQWQEFHAKPSTDKSEVFIHYKRFIQKAGNILRKKEKSETFENILSFPLKSTQVVSKSSDEWNKIFTAQDRSLEYYFDKEDLVKDFTKYLEDIGIQDIVEQNIFTLAKQSINTIAVVDMPAPIIEEVNVGEYETSASKVLFHDSNFVNPYVYLLDVSNVIDADEDHRGNIEYVIFRAGEDNEKIVAIDGEYYRVFDLINDEPVFKFEEPHGLGYCPAKTIWSDNISPYTPIRRFNAVTEVLSDMDKLVMSDVFSQHTDLYSGFPIMWRYVARCTYEEITGDGCRNGMVPYIDNNGQRQHKECPACAKNKGLVGPGTLVDLPIPTEKEQPIIKEPVNFVEPDVQLLEYNQKKVEKIAAHIDRMLTGGELQTTDKDAVNEDQVRSQYESKQDILVGWAENFQKIHKFIVDTIGRLRYGDKYKGCTINYGFNFFLINMNIATREYKDAVEAGLPMYMRAEKRRAVEAIYIGNSPEKRDRIQMLQMLEPYVDLPIDSVEKGTFEYELKANFSNYISKFESEFGLITLFGLNKPLHFRITTILKHLKSYVESGQKGREEFLRKFGPGEEVSDQGVVVKGGGDSAVKTGEN